MTAAQETSVNSRPSLSRHPRVAAAFVAGAMGLCAWLQFRGGAADVPAPLLEILEAFFGYPPELSARLIASSTVAGAVIVFLYGVIFENRFLPIVACALGTFVSLACVSRALSAGGLGFPVVALAASLLLLWWMLRTRPRPVGVHATPRRGLSPGWTALGAIALATGTGAVAGRATDPNRPVEIAPKPAGPKVVNVDFDMHPFVGRRVEETPIGASLPGLPERTRGQTTFVVFYLPNCHACHSLFDQFFSSPRVEQVFTVEIPPADGVPQVDTGEEPEPMVCVGCEPLLLPTGPNYLVASPMVVKIEDGVVTCVSDRFKGECLLAP